MMTEPPIGIIKTLPPCYLDDKAKEGAVFHRCIKRMQGESEEQFGFALSSKPKHEVLYVYVLCAGAIRWRFTVLNFTQASHRCLDGVNREGTWVYCCGPVITLKAPVAMRGFRGFRYTSNLWE